MSSTNDALPSPAQAAVAAELRRGQAAEAQGDLAAALQHYDAAITLAGPATISEPSETGRLRAVAWMNRGNALQKLAMLPPAARGDAPAGDPGPAAVSAYDEAVTLLRALPLAENVAYRNHLGAALLNRGHALLALENFPTAAQSFASAIAQLASLPLDENPAYRLNLAGAHANLAHTHLGSPQQDRGNWRPSPGAAYASARLVFPLVSAHASSHLAFAEMDLRARRAFVTAIGQLLVRSDAPQSLITEASDAIDDGLALARTWEAQGNSQLRPLALRLFTLGTHFYRIHQPQFLAEFLEENISGDACFARDEAFHRTALSSLQAALETLAQPRHFTIGDPTSERHLALVQSLRALQSQLAAPLSA